MAASTLVTLTKILATTAGTGPFTLGSAVAGFRGREALGNGLTYSYSVQQGAAYEVGTGVFTSSTGVLTRDVQVSSNGGAAVDFRAGAAVKSSALDQGSKMGRKMRVHKIIAGNKPHPCLIR